MNAWLILFLVLGASFFVSWQLLQQPRRGLRRLGFWGLVGTTAMVGWVLTEEVISALVAGSAWLVLPTLQALFFSRKFRLPRRRSLQEGSLDPEEFPAAFQIGGVLSRLGFQGDKDYWLKPAQEEQAFRLFHKADEGIVAAVSVARHGDVSLTYSMFITRDRDGVVWITWDYPMPYFLRRPPHVHMFRCTDTENVEELYGQHRAFLEINGVVPDGIFCGEPSSFLKRLFEELIDYNVAIGHLRELGGNDDLEGTHIGFTWRGSLFVGWQVFREVLVG